ncbi:MAG TPA: hypothetical protein VLM89_03145 [Phycisphaerae bacterium]|nr:hypothetical protein [Phycisphaerae bacterium]
MSEPTGATKHAWLRALGPRELPVRIVLADGEYVHLKTYKHDFFAATGLYEGPGGKVILKMGRTASLLGIPMSWLGRRLARREHAIYRELQGVPGVPRCDDLFEPTGLIHAFVEGHPLQRRERVDDAFFDDLGRLIDELHQRRIAYVDLEKRENILVDDRGRPALIDFQISWWWPEDRSRRQGLGRLLPGLLGRYILARLQVADCYHLLKHRRRHRPDLLTPEQVRASYRCGPLVRIHRVVSWPFTALRRTILKALTGRSRSLKQDGPEFLDPAPGKSETAEPGPQRPI